MVAFLTAPISAQFTAYMDILKKSIANVKELITHFKKYKEEKDTFSYFSLLFMLHFCLFPSYFTLA
jgi:hypothetical protein